jgi:hypothetical protein
MGKPPCLMLNKVLSQQRRRRVVAYMYSKTIGEDVRSLNLRPPSRVVSSMIDYRMKVPTLDNLRNFLLTPTAEMLSFFQQLREAP